MILFTDVIFPDKITREILINIDGIPLPYIYARHVNYHQINTTDNYIYLTINNVWSSQYDCRGLLKPTITLGGAKDIVRKSIPFNIDLIEVIIDFDLGV